MPEAQIQPFGQTDHLVHVIESFEICLAGRERHVNLIHGRKSGTKLFAVVAADIHQNVRISASRDPSPSHRRCRIFACNESARLTVPA